MATKRVKINRAPVLTLWAVIVAERLGHDRDAALTLGKALAGLNAQSKGKRLGIFSEPEKKEGEAAASKERVEMKTVRVTLLGRAVPAMRTKEGLRAAFKGEAMDPQTVRRYLAQKFGADLPEVEGAMQEVAKSYSPQELETRGFSLYEAFRPNVPEGEKGWGAKGELDLGKLRSLAK